MPKNRYDHEFSDDEDMRRGKKKENHRRKDRNRAHKKSWDEIEDVPFVDFREQPRYKY